MAETSYIEIYPRHTLSCPLPNSLDQGMHWIFYTRSQHSFPASSITVLPEGRVWGQDGTVITWQGKLLGNASDGYDKPSDGLPAFDNPALPPPQRLHETAAVIAFPYSANYFHWMFDILPRFHLLKQSGIACDKYIMDYSGYAFQKETLSWLGIPETKIIPIHSQLHLQARRLLIPSLPRHGDYMPGWATSFLHTQFTANKVLQSQKQYDRVYISRSDAGYRRVVNEDQVVKLLEGFGFTTVTLGSLPVAEQAAVFSSASIIISPHGAGLTNLVFCRPGTKVIEIFSPNYIRHTYWWIAQHLDLDYYYIVGKGERPAHGVDQCDMEDNIEIPLQAEDLLGYFRKYSRITQPIGINDAKNIRHWQKINEIKGWLLQSEAVALQWLVKQLPVNANVVELGGLHGRVSVVIASALPPGGILHCFVCCTDDENPDQPEANLRRYQANEKVRVVKPVPPVPETRFAPESLDLIFVDAGRDYESVRNDAVRWYSRLKPGGYMAFHDYGWWPGIKEAVESLQLGGYLMADSLWLHRKPDGDLPG